jgi:hypothetical protein
MNDDYVTITEAARILGCNRPTVYRLIEEGKVRAFRRAYIRDHGPVFVERNGLEELARFVPVGVPA